jgi:hypothetical protein
LPTSIRNMNRIRALAIADRSAPLALKLIAGANMLFLGAFLATLIAVAEQVRP